MRVRKTGWRQPGSWQRVLVLQLAPLGDTLFGTPALRALREATPAEIHAVTWTANAGIVRDNPCVDQLHPCKNTLELLGLFTRWRTEEVRFDVAFGLSNIGTAALPLVLARRKVGFNSPHLGWLYGRDLPRQSLHAVDYCLRVVALAGVEVHQREPRLEIFFGEEERAFAREFFRSQGIGPAEPVVAIHPGGRFFSVKRWHAGGFAAVADHLAIKHGAKIIFVGGRDDLPLAEKIAGLMRTAPVLAAGRTSLKQTAALLEAVTFFIGNDSFPQHLAAAVGTPVIALFGPTNPQNFRPYGTGHLVIRKELPCSPCFHWLGSPVQYLPRWHNPNCRRECMSGIEAAEVIRAAETMLARWAGRRERFL